MNINSTVLLGYKPPADEGYKPKCHHITLYYPSIFGKEHVASSDSPHPFDSNHKQITMS